MYTDKNKRGGECTCWHFKDQHWNSPRENGQERLNKYKQPTRCNGGTCYRAGAVIPSCNCMVFRLACRELTMCAFSDYPDAYCERKDGHKGPHKAPGHIRVWHKKKV